MNKNYLIKELEEQRQKIEQINEMADEINYSGNIPERILIKLDFIRENINMNLEKLEKRVEGME